MRMVVASLLGVVLMASAGCMHLKGSVDDGTGRPATTAVLSVHRPNGVSAASEHHVDTKGRFDFWISAFDENEVYLFDELGDPQTTMRRVDSAEFGDQMRLTIPSGIHRGDLIHEMP